MTARGRNRRRVPASWAPVVLCGATLLVGSAAPGAGQSDLERTRGALSVRSRPDAASVYLDGRLVGRTPLALPEVAAGDHRVTLLKDGYLENSRAVSVAGGEWQNVSLSLTADARGNALRMQVDDEPKAGPPAAQEVTKGGGSKKVLLIAAPVVVGGGLAAYLVATKNHPPTPGTVLASPTTALMSVTPVSFTAQGASDPDGDALSYAWDFGDGSTGTGATATHVYAREGAVQVRVTVSDGKQSASATGSVTVKSLSGVWRATWSWGEPFTFDVRQSGTSLSGSYATSWGSHPDTFSGQASAPRTVDWRFDYYCGSFRGTANEALTEIDGAWECPGFRENIRLTR